MLKKIWQSILFVLGLSLIAALQVTAIVNWPSFFNQINIVLVMVIFILFFWGFRVATWSVLISGLWLDIFSFNFFGLYIISLFLVVWAAERISVRLLTNRSFYSLLLLLLVSTVLYNFIVMVLSYFSATSVSIVFLAQKSFWRMLVYQGAWSIILAILMFNLSTIITKRLQPFFLEKK